MINYVFLPLTRSGHRGPTPGQREKARGQKGLLLLKGPDPEPERTPGSGGLIYPRAGSERYGWPRWMAPKVLRKVGLTGPRMASGLSVASSGLKDFHLDQVPHTWGGF